MTDKHLSTQFDAELSGVSTRVLEMGGLVESQVAQAIYALTNFSAETATQVLRMEERVKDLAAAMTKLRSFVVKSKWYDAMIDAGRGAEILPEVDQEIGNTRYQSTWLIRRARIRLKNGDAPGATADLAAALTEIESRLRPEVPDLSLICDRGLIHELQGNHAAALADLEMARKSGADFWMLMPLEALVGSYPMKVDAPPPKVSIPTTPDDPARDGNVK